MPLHAILFGIVAPSISLCQTLERGNKTLLWQESVPPSLNKTRSFFVFVHDTLLTRRGVVAYLPIIIATVCMFCGASWQIFLPKTDPARYQCYALTFWLGSNATKLLPSTQCSFLALSSMQPAFHMLPKEYPALTILPFSLALLAPLAYYQLFFALLMSLIMVLVYWLLLRFGPKGAALVFAFYMFIGAIATAQVRYDLIPAVLTLLCVIAAERKHWTAAYVALAFGVLFKIYPILLLPALFLAEQHSYGRLKLLPAHGNVTQLPGQFWLLLQSAKRWHWHNFAFFVSLVGGVTGFFALFNFQGAVLDQITYFVSRPIQVEAAGSSLLWLGSHFGFPVSIDDHFGSLNLLSSLGGIVGMLGTCLLLSGVVYTLWLQWSGKLDIAQACIALLLVFVASGKVFSPQYLIWLIPLLTYAGVFDGMSLLMWSAVSLATTYIYSYLYTRPVATLLDIPYIPGFIEAVTLRNTFFVLFTLAYLFNWFQVRERKPLQVTLQDERTFPLYEEGETRNREVHA